MNMVLNITRPSVCLFICNNQNFLPGLSDKVFSLWRGKGLTTVKDFYVNGKFATFEYLYKTFNLSQSYFFRYLQVRHYIKHSFNEFQDLPQDHVMYDLLGQPPMDKHLVTRFVSLFVSHFAVSSEHLRVAWENDTGINISNEIWEEGLK